MTRLRTEPNPSTIPPLLITGDAAGEVGNALSRRDWAVTSVTDEPGLCLAAWRMRSPMAFVCDRPSDAMLRRILLWGGQTWVCGDYNHEHPYCNRIEVYGPAEDDYTHHGIDGNFETWGEAVDSVLWDLQ